MSGNALLDLLIISVPLLGILLWWTGSRAHELAVQHARRACQQQQLQFLDQTVALRRMRLARGTSGAYGVQRDYSFEFTDYGDFRDVATVSMHNDSLLKVHFPYTRDADGHRIYLH